MHICWKRGCLQSMQFCHYQIRQGTQQQSPFQTYGWNIIFFFTPLSCWTSFKFQLSSKEVYHLKGNAQLGPQGPCHRDGLLPIWDHFIAWFNGGNWGVPRKIKFPLPLLQIPVGIATTPKPRRTWGRVLKVSSLLVINPRCGRQKCIRIEMVTIHIKCVPGKLLYEKPEVLLEIIKCALKNIRDKWDHWEC